MDVNDRVYGRQKIEEDVLIEIINSPEMQRLKKISQFGMPDEYYHKKGFSRYEHSLGVFFLVRMLKGGLEEQIAGLSHDVSHTAFSHVIDWALGDPSKEDYQDNRHLKFIKNSSLASIFRQNGFSAENIANLHSFHLVDYPAPDLCADRIDYTLENFAKLPKVLKENSKNKFFDTFNFKKVEVFERAKSCLFRGCKSQELSVLEHLEIFFQKISKFRKTIYSNFSKDIEDKDDYGILKVLECCENSFILRELDFLKRTLQNCPKFSKRTQRTSSLIHSTLKTPRILTIRFLDAIKNFTVLDELKFLKERNLAFLEAANLKNFQFLNTSRFSERKSQSFAKRFIQTSLKKGFKVEKNTGPVSFLLRKKFRYVDPMVLYGSKILRLSKIREDYKRTLESDREKSLNEARIAIAR